MRPMVSAGKRMVPIGWPVDLGAGEAFVDFANARHRLYQAIDDRRPRSAPRRSGWWRSPAAARRSCWRACLSQSTYPPMPSRSEPGSDAASTSARARHHSLASCECIPPGWSLAPARTAGLASAPAYCRPWSRSRGTSSRKGQPADPAPASRATIMPSSNRLRDACSSCLE